MLYDGICVCMFNCGCNRMWLHVHVYMIIFYYWYINICMTIYIFMIIYGYWYGSRWVSPECKMSMSLSPFGNSYVSSYARIFTIQTHQRRPKAVIPLGPTSTTMAFYSVNMHHCYIKFLQQTWSHECLQVPRTLASCQPTAAAQHYRMLKKPSDQWCGSSRWYHVYMHMSYISIVHIYDCVHLANVHNTWSSWIISTAWGPFKSNDRNQHPHMKRCEIAPVALRFWGHSRRDGMPFWLLLGRVRCWRGWWNNWWSNKQGWTFWTRLGIYCLSLWPYCIYTCK